MVPQAGLEPATYRLGICRSVLMSYWSNAVEELATRLGGANLIELQFK